MNREAFARAWRFLDYKPGAKWIAMSTAVATAVLYVALLLLLVLFADLIVYRGSIPVFSALSGQQQRNFYRRWELLSLDEYLPQVWSRLSEEQKKQRLADGGVDEAKAAELADADLSQLTPADQQAVYAAYRDPLVQRRARMLKDAGAGEIASELASTNPQQLSGPQRELWWRADVYVTLSELVPGAENLVKVSGRSADTVTVGDAKEFADRGILGLVIRSRDRFYGPAVVMLARWARGTWQPGPGPTFERYLLSLLVAGLVLALLRFAAMFAMGCAAAAVVTEASNRLRRAVYHHTFRLGTLAFRALGPSEAVGMFTRQVEAVHEGLYIWLTVIYREPVKFALLLAVALAVDAWLTLLFLIAALLVWVVGGQVAVSFRRQERSANNRAAEQLALLQESLMLMRLVKCYLMELFNQSRVERQLAAYAEARLRRYHGEAIYRPMLVFLGTATGLVLLCVAGLTVLRGRLGVDSAIVLATALVSLYWPLVSWLENRRAIRRARAAAAALFGFLDRPGEVGQVVGAEFLPPLGQQLEFDGVSLLEPGTGRRLLDGVNLTVQAGQRIGIVGPDDMEKHALVYLIPRFLDPAAGEIRVDGHNLRWVTFESLRAQIAIVLEHNLVFNDTVANNIGCGEPGYDLPKIIEAAKLVHAHYFIQKLPQGYETPIGEMGHFLSISEKFRIALARALIRDPALVIIEEPTVSLDEETQALLDDTYARSLPGRTVIFLPHRLSTIRSCDRVFLLHRGQVEAAGEHRDLLSQNELYRHLQYIEFNEFVEQV